MVLVNKLGSKIMKSIKYQIIMSHLCEVRKYLILILSPYLFKMRVYYISVFKINYQLLQIFILPTKVSSFEPFPIYKMQYLLPETHSHVGQ